MKLTLDITQKEISIDDSAPLKEVVNFMKKRFKKDWEEWTIVPIISYPAYYHYPFFTTTFETGDRVQPLNEDYWKVISSSAGQVIEKVNTD